MRPASWLAASLLGIAPQVARADCLGDFTSTEKGYKLEGDRLESTGETVAAGTELKFNGIGKFRNTFDLLRARSNVTYDAQIVELTSGCDLPTREIPNAR